MTPEREKEIRELVADAESWRENDGEDFYPPIAAAVDLLKLVDELRAELCNARGWDVPKARQEGDEEGEQRGRADGFRAGVEAAAAECERAAVGGEWARDLLQQRILADAIRKLQPPGKGG